MAELAEMITGEFEDALEVKNPKSLHRAVYLILSNSVKEDDHREEHRRLDGVLEKIGRHIEILAVEMREGFKRMDERFEAVDRRFEAVDRRFEAVDQRFEAMDKRFEAMDKRFEAMDKRFQDRFEALDRRFNRLTILLTTLISLGFLGLGTLVTLFQFAA
jgi:DNA anti-recombination protein RmuC